MFRICPARRVCDSRHGKTACKLLCGGFSLRFGSAASDFRAESEFDFAALVFSRLLAAGALSKVRLAFASHDPPRKNRLQMALRRFSFASRALRPRTFEPNPRFELGTPSLRVKCSTAELIRLSTARENFGFVFYRSLRDCKYQKKKFFSQQFCKNSLNSCYIRGKTDPDRCL